MVTWSAYLEAAQAYASGVRALIVPADQPAGARTRRQRSSADLIQCAEALSPLSSSLTQVTSELLDHAHPLVRSEVSARLLAKALSDCQVSAFLYQAAQNEGGLIRSFKPRANLTRAFELDDVEENLGFLLSEMPKFGGAAVRAEQSAAPQPDLAAARKQLGSTTVNTLVDIRDRAAKSGQIALGGLLGLGVGELAQAAALVGVDLASRVGQGAEASRLYAQVREFLIKAYDSLIAVMGPDLARAATNQVTAWVAELQSGAQLGKLLEKLYETEKTGADLGQIIAASQATPDKLVTVGQGLDLLSQQYQKQSVIAEKMGRVLVLAGGSPLVTLPYGRIVMATCFIVLGGYMIVAGANFVDSPRLPLLNRVPGVRRVVMTGLNASVAQTPAGASTSTPASAIPAAAATPATAAATSTPSGGTSAPAPATSSGTSAGAPAPAATPATSGGTPAAAPPAPAPAAAPSSANTSSGEQPTVPLTA